MTMRDGRLDLIALRWANRVWNEARGEEDINDALLDAVNEAAQAVQDQCAAAASRPSRRYLAGTWGDGFAAGVQAAANAVRDVDLISLEEAPVAAKCKSCGAALEWAVTPQGKRMPLDLGDFPTGNLTVKLGVAFPRTDAHAAEGLPARQSHYASCPQANMWRKR